MRGAALAELLVALLIGLLVSLFAASLLAAANLSYAAQEETARLDDAGRFAIEAVSRAVRQASWTDPEARGAARDAPAAITGLDARSLSRADAALDAPQTGQANGSDVLALRFAGAADGSVLDCAGFSVGAGEDGWSIFYVAPGPDGEEELRCKYRGDKHWNADAIVQGVDSFQILYGVDTGTITFLNAAGVNALDLALALEGDTAEARQRDLQRKTHWKHIVAIKLALLLHSTRPAREDADSARYALFGPAYDHLDDRGAVLDARLLPPEQRKRLRRLFTATITLRNSPD